MFFFANYSYVNDYIPGKNQGFETIPANAEHLAGDFSDLLPLPNPAQYQIYDPLTVRPDPANPSRFIRVAVSEQHDSGEPDRESALQPVQADGAARPTRTSSRAGTTPTDNYYRGGEPDVPVSHLYGGRVDYNASSNDRFFFRGAWQHLHRGCQRLDVRSAGVRRTAFDRPLAVHVER